MKVLSMEALPFPRIKAKLAIGVDCEGSITVELDLIHPLRAVRECRHSQAFHGFNKSGFSARYRKNAISREALLSRGCF
jgi:hypothetical protein